MNNTNLEQLSDQMKRLRAAGLARPQPANNNGVLTSRTPGGVIRLEVAE